MWVVHDPKACSNNPINASDDDPKQVKAMKADNYKKKAAALTLTKALQADSDSEEEVEGWRQSLSAFWPFKLLGIGTAINMATTRLSTILLSLVTNYLIMSAIWWFTNLVPMTSEYTKPDINGQMNHQTACRHQTKWKKKNRRQKIWKHMQHIATDVAKVLIIRSIDATFSWLMKNHSPNKDKWRQQRNRSKSTGGQYNTSLRRRHAISSRYSAIPAICMVATNAYAAKPTNSRTAFNRNSVFIHVDNCASQCISHLIKDFKGTPKRVLGKVKGIGGN